MLVGELMGPKRILGLGWLSWLRLVDVGVKIQHDHLLPLLTSLLSLRCYAGVEERKVKAKVTAEVKSKASGLEIAVQQQTRSTLNSEKIPLIRKLYHLRPTVDSPY